MTVTPGTRIGPYDVVALIGAGGMGEVYRATDARLGRDVALKVLPAAFAEDRERVARFEREARAVAALSHPNVLAIFDVGTHGGIAYAAMELLSGETLRERLHNGALSVRHVVQYGVQLSRGLAAAHDKGLVHRDLKPENIFLLADGQVKILDFGLARVAAEAEAANAASTVAAMTDVGIVMGTAAYMAPEQVRGEPVDARCDLFALGAVLYEMLTGTRAFQRGTTAETMTAILKDDPPEIMRPGADLPPALDRIVRHCVEKSRVERFQTARDVAFALEVLSGTVSTSKLGAPAISAPRRRPGIAAATFAAGALVAGLSALALRSTPPASEPTNVKFAQRTFEEHVINTARFLPDGRRIVYSARRPGQLPQIFELADGGLAPRVIGTGRLMAVSSKGELAVLLEEGPSTNLESLGTLARMIPGGAPRAVVERVTHADWSPDGETFAVVRRGSDGDRLEYPVGTVLATSSGFLSHIRVSPDGSRVAFMDHPTENDYRGSVRVVTKAGAVSTLAGEFVEEQGVAWSQDGRHVLFSAGSEGQATRILSVPADVGSTTAAPTPVVVAPGDFVLMDRGADGRLLAASVTRRFGVGVRLRGEVLDRDLSWLDMSWDPSLSRSGDVLVFTDGRNGGRGGFTYATVLRKTDGSPVVRLGEGASFGISPDGRWAIAATVQSASPALFAYPVGAGAPIAFRRGAVTTYFNEMPAVWMPDSQAFLFWGAEADRAPRTYLQTLKGEEPVPVLPAGVRAVLVTPDGRHVIGADDDGHWKTYPLEGGAPAPVPGLVPTTRYLTRSSNSPGDFPIGWSDDQRAVLARAGSAPTRIDRVDLRTGVRRTVANLGTIGVVTASADGQQYAYEYARALSTLFEVQGAAGK